jgi:N-dimethylarginine dimethylaminohydrolase
MTAGFGISDTVAPLRRVLVRPPDESFAASDPAKWNYSAPPDLAAARREHQLLVETLEGAGARVEFHREALEDRADAIFVYDPTLMTDEGAVLLRLGKELRAGEDEAIGRRLVELGIPVLGRLEGEARAEGGDLLRIDARTLAVGIGFRTNRAAAQQLAELLKPQGITVVAYDLPCFLGQRACLHLLSMVSLLAEDLALIYPRLMPVDFWKLLASRFELVEVPEEEFMTLGTNVLALAPRQCLALEGNHETRRRMEAAGCEVLTYIGNELSLKAEGGPTCLTLPLHRAAG